MFTTEKSVMKKFTSWLAVLACASVLAACGGGGGSPGTNSQGVAPSKAAAISLTASANTIASSGLAGTEVTLTAIVKDSNNQALSNETLSFKSSSGSVSSATYISDATGTVTAKLSVAGDSSLRTITITASDGGVTSSPVTVQVVAAVPTLTLTTSSLSLASSGAAGSEVNVVALVRDASNSVVPGVAVTLAANSGSLTNTNRVTDANGMVQEKLSTGSDPTSRTITLTASVPGAAPVTTIVNVVGTKLQINAPSTVNVGASADITIKLVDSAGNALANKAVTFKSGINSLSVKGGGAAVTNSVGQLTLSYAASSGGGSSDTITVQSTGETATAPISISTSNFYVEAVDGSGNALALANINACQAVLIHADNGGTPVGGTVQLSSSRGSVYSDSGCTSAASSLTFSGGNATAYVTATSPGIATLTATASGMSAQGTLEFVAPLTATTTVTVQADPAVVAANTAGSSSQQSTLRVIVRDGTAQNNLVKNAQVAFSIAQDASGGTLTQPSVVTTGADGSATVSYVAGTSTTPLDGVQIKAQVLSPVTSASGTVGLTVGAKALFISAGTGNTVGTPSSTSYQLDFDVIVTDASGAPVQGVNVTASVLPVYYYKGVMAYLAPNGPWSPVTHVQCANEDLSGSGIYLASEDINGNGVLDPGIPVAVTPSAATTNALGQATVSLVYAREQAYWLDVNLTIRGQVSGSEARYVGYVSLPGLATDFNTQNVTPPNGGVSPYGTANSCSNPK